MSSTPQLPTLAFLWRSIDIASSVVDAARSTRTRALFDISAAPVETAETALLQADAGPDAVELKASPSALYDAALEGLLRETGIRRIWVELHPLTLDRAPDYYLDRMEQLSDNCECVPVLSDFSLVEQVINRRPAIRTIALKGSEAAGLVSSETAFTLYASVRRLAGGLADPPGIVIWGGVAASQAAAAFLAAGAAGIVFESLHWLTDLVSLEDKSRAKISNLRPEHANLVGLPLQAPCRLFNKGNSLAVKKLKEFAGSVCGAEIGDPERRNFVGKIQSEAVHPLSARFDRDEIIELGVETAFCRAFVRDYGSSTEEAIHGFAQEIERLCAAAGEKAKAFTQSPAAAELGARYPFIQGAMSWITDEPKFALEIAEGGGLPTIALGLMDQNALQQRLGDLPRIMGDRPYAVNVITLAENPHRDAQLAWIKTAKPRFAVIAAGEPSHARELLDSGVEVIYIAPNEELLRMAFEAGVRWAVCEGCEAGGHVGEHSTLTIAQIISDLRHKEPGLFKDRRIILAGGICNRETAFMAAMLGADAVQMGTVYLTTKEIVGTGALSSLYQRMVLQAKPGDTTVTGEATGLRVRSLRTGRIEEICTLEREFASGAEDEASFRRKIETLAAGSLLIAARGVSQPGGASLDETTCLEQGQFMSGACAGFLEGTPSIGELHHELADGKLAPGLPFLGPVREEAAPRVKGVKIEETLPSDFAAAGYRPVHRSEGKERIAITGMSVVNSLGNSPEEVWAASLAGKSGIIEVPKSKWDHELYYHPRPRMPEKTYCKVGGFQDLDVSRKDIGVAPQDFRTMTNSTRFSMWLAKNAVEQSGILDSDIPRERIGVLISQNSGEAAVTLQDFIIRGSAGDIVSKVKRVIDLSRESERAIEEEVKSGRLIIDDTTLLGRLNCTAGGFICKKYGFMGPSFSVSAACATALVALYSAYQMIRNNIIDAAVVGGAEELMTPIHFLEFSALGALSGILGVERAPHEYSRPFDASRDGMVMGEGGGMIVIERESVARARGAKIHAFITAMGASNNHLGLVESSRQTQAIAMRASFDDAPYSPNEVDLIECHATSTMQGDIEEIHALHDFFDPAYPTTLTSFKSQIGHTLGASGVNSLIRGVMAMNHGAFPPTLNFQQPDPGVDLRAMGFSIFTQAAEWTQRNSAPRRFQVNAFGFGGSNYVVHVEQNLDDRAAVLVSPAGPKPRGKVNGSSVQLPDGVSFFKTEIGGSPYNLAVTAATEREALSIIDAQAPIRDQGGLSAKQLRSLAKQGVYLGRVEQTMPGLAFVFPGQGSHYAGMSHELYQTFPVIKQWMDRVAKVAEFDILDLLFFNTEEDLQKTRWQQPALFTMEIAIVNYLASLGVQPAAAAGHSLGELTALCLAGVYSLEDGFRIVNKRALCMDKACEMNVDPGVMMAVDAPLDYIEKRLAALDGVYVTNINSPHQVVIGGNTETVKALGEELKQEGYRRTLLRVSMAFHSPIMRCIHDELQAFVDTVEFHPPKFPVISNTTRKPFPADTSEIKRIVMAHLESPVHWMENVRVLWDDLGVRRFVEIGPRDILSNMIGDTVQGADCVQTCQPAAEAVTFRAAAAQLYAKGHLPVEDAKFVAFPGQKKPSRAVAGAGTPVCRGAASTLHGAGELGMIIQREINSFVLESFGRFLKPAIVAAVRREYNPAFREEDLDGLLGASTPRGEAFLPTPAPASPRAIEPAPQLEPPAGKAETEVSDEITEAIIQIIMETTGYERDEISADMDIREDLAIRSSRLPVIMDALESHFGIKVEIEEFMDVRTIADISGKISEITGKGAKPTAVKRPKEDSIQTEERVDVDEDKPSIRRAIFVEAPLEKAQPLPISIPADETVVVFSDAGAELLRDDVRSALIADHGVDPVDLAFLASSPEPDGIAQDLRSENGASLTAQRLSNMKSIAGFVFVLDERGAANVGDPVDAANILRGVFVALKALMDSPNRKFAVLLYRPGDKSGPCGLVFEGILGMFLSLAHEFSSVQFRAVRLEDGADAGFALRKSLDRSAKVVQMIMRGNDAFTLEGRISAVPFQDDAQAPFRTGDVVVISGGAYGITNHIARRLLPFGCRVVFLGRTSLDPDIDFNAVLAAGPDWEAALAAAVNQARPDLAPDELNREISSAGKSFEIIRNVESLRSQGADASYYRCDVNDAERTADVIADILSRFGRIDGIIHGAGVIRDSFFKQMAPEDFSAALSVKLLGAWNLFTAARDAGLRFFVSLSSAAAIQGNPGQTNYSCANRVTSALMSYLQENAQSLTCKALILPPIEGTGMAEDPEIRAMMKRMNAGYVHVEELGELFCREMTFAPIKDVWTMFMRTLPDVKTTRIDFSVPDAKPGEMEIATVTFNSEDFPLLDTVTKVDLEKGAVEALRDFSQEIDLWVSDHKPFKFIRYPIVSAVMALEAFMEAARLLYPHMVVRRVRDARFLDMLDCPPGEVRSSVIQLGTVQKGGGEVHCRVTLKTRAQSRPGQGSDRLSPNFEGTLILGVGYESPHLDFPGFPVTRDEFDSRPMDRQEALKKYEKRSDMQGRYRIIEEMDGASRTGVRGRMTYLETEDFAAPKKTRYQYSPYILDGLMQASVFHFNMRDENDERLFIPYNMGEAVIFRKCRNGEIVTLEGRLKRQDDKGILWDARALDAEGRPVMYLSDMAFPWFSG